jgi:tyrosine-protein kinase Etk/Wzc
MNESLTRKAHEQTNEAGSEAGILETMVVVARRKKFVIVLPLLVGSIVAALSFALPNIYKAGARLLPPQQQSTSMALLSQLGGGASLAAGMAGLKNPNDLYVAMLKSRTIADRLISRFSLKNVYDTKSLEEARSELANNTSVISGKDGLIVIEVEDQDRKRVALIANAYVEELLRLTKVLAVTGASQRRMFFEKELEAAKDNLSKAEMNLKQALNSRGVTSVDAESRAVIERLARLRAAVSAKEIQINAMRAFVTEANPEFMRTNEELKSLRAELSKMENGTEGSSLNAAQTPEGLQSIKILRDVKYYEMLYELLSKQFEIARLDEAKDPSLIQVLDPAIEPERKVKPRRALIVLGSMLAAMVCAIAWILVEEKKKRLLSSPVMAEKWQELSSLVRFRRKAG